MWGDWIVGPALCFVGVLPLAVARAELWRLRTSGRRQGTARWVALLAVALAQFIAVAAVTVEIYGQRRAAAFQILGVAVGMAVVQLPAAKGRAAAARGWMMGLGFAAGLLAILFAAR